MRRRQSCHAVQDQQWVCCHWQQYLQWRDPSTGGPQLVFKKDHTTVSEICSFQKPFKSGTISSCTTALLLYPRHSMIHGWPWQWCPVSPTVSCVAMRDCVHTSFKPFEGTFGWNGPKLSCVSWCVHRSHRIKTLTLARRQAFGRRTEKMHVFKSAYLVWALNNMGTFINCWSGWAGWPIKILWAHKRTCVSHT